MNPTTNPTVNRPRRNVTGRTTPRRLALIGAGVAVTIAACGSDSTSTPEPEPAAPPPAEAAADAPAAAPAPAAVTTASSELGEILVGADGLTVYGFTNDTDAVSTCYGTCAEAWPPVIVDEDWSVAPGLDSGIFATTTRDDGSLQLVAGKWPLYYFAGDTAAGDTAGQNSGEVWFVVDTDGVLIQGEGAADGIADDAETAEPAAAEETEALAVQVAATDLGDVLVDAAGMTLYGFTPDAGANPTCEGACADAWPPILVDEVPAGLDPAVFSTATRPDGSTQLVAGQWPLYLFAGDAVPGDTAGQGSGDQWFVVAPDGGLIGAAQGAVAPVEQDEPSDGGYDY